jgi:hypothetical protein
LLAWRHAGILTRIEARKQRIFGVFQPLNPYSAISCMQVLLNQYLAIDSMPKSLILRKTGQGRPPGDTRSYFADSSLLKSVVLAEYKMLRADR